MSVVYSPGRLTALAAKIETYPETAEELMARAGEEITRSSHDDQAINEILEVWRTVLLSAPQCAQTVVDRAVTSPSQWGLLYWMLDTPEARQAWVLDILLAADERIHGKGEPTTPRLYDTALEVSIVDAVLGGKIQSWNHLLGLRNERRLFASRYGSGNLAFMVMDGLLTHGKPLVDGLEAVLLRAAITQGGDLESPCSYKHPDLDETTQVYPSLLAFICGAVERQQPNAQACVHLLLDFGAQWEGLDDPSTKAGTCIRQHERWKAWQRRQSLFRIAHTTDTSQDVRQL